MKFREYLNEESKVLVKIKHAGHKYELRPEFRWGGLLTHIVFKDGEEVGQLAPNLDPKIAIKTFKADVKKNVY